MTERKLFYTLAGIVIGIVVFLVGSLVVWRDRIALRQAPAVRCIAFCAPLEPTLSTATGCECHERFDLDRAATACEAFAKGKPVTWTASGSGLTCEVLYVENLGVLKVVPLPAGATPPPKPKAESKKEKR